MTVQVPSYRQAGRLLDVQPRTVRVWVERGYLTPPPWTHEELFAARDRKGAPRRDRGIRSRHGTPARWATGCSCALCRAANAEQEAVDERRRAAGLFPPEQRRELLELLATGMLFPTAVRQLGLSHQRVWGRAQAEPEWDAQLTAVLDANRPADLPHGKQRAHMAGCRCSDCRHFWDR